MSEITRYRHRWKLPSGTFEYEFEGTRWCKTKEEALATRKGLIERSKIPENGDYTEYFQEDWEWDVEKEKFPVLEVEVDKVVVLLSEEYGYRDWLWHTGMTEKEVAAFWEGLESVAPYFHSPKGLPGVLAPAWWQEDGGDGVWSTTSNQSPEGPVFVTGLHWSGHLHEDSDSGIGYPSTLLREGRSLRHKGYTGYTGASVHRRVST